ncbi:TniB family NTP-binding protein [Luethyella okanaganae]|uniref:TniB family NTP-binding protein n=1 Tax=Luethyella okanaganae TaxID=69372 RepID=A0ABW1VF77_9MICO
MTDIAVIATPQLMSIMKAARDKLYLNEFKRYARNGLIVSGEPMLGKTTTVIRIGREHERRRRLQGHPSGAAGMLPVIYVTVPPACGPKDMLVQFADFLGLPHGHRISRTEMMSSVAAVMRTVRTELVIVDEIHNLNLSRQQSMETSDALKQLSEQCAATFVYAGINVDQSGLFTGLRGQQIAGRFDTHHVTRFTNATAAGRSDWESLLVDFEDTLGLIEQTPGTILEFSGQFFAHAGGSIGKLADTLRSCSLEAMTSGQERLSKDILRSRGVLPPKAVRAPSATTVGAA